MAKLSLVNREKKRQALVAKFYDKRVRLNKIIKDMSKSKFIDQLHEQACIINRTSFEHAQPTNHGC